MLRDRNVMHILVAVLLALHGAIHVLALRQASARPLAGWLLAALILVTSAVALLARASWWWWAAGLGIVLSQALISYAWKAAKAGTLLNLALALPIALAAADARFSSQTTATVRGLATQPVDPQAFDVVREDELRKLPKPVARWLAASGVVGKPRAVAVRLTQKGAIRTSPDGSWLPATAEQFFRVDDPAFVWRVHTRMYGLPIAGRDVYVHGRGQMKIELGALIPLVDARGARIDQGTLQRYLGEIVWFPSAALREYIAWEPIDAHSARATMRHRGVTGSAMFAFDAAGRVVRVSARRYMGSGPDARLEDWSVPVRAWHKFEGVQVPAAGDVIWRLPAGDFNYFQWQITSVQSHAQPREARPDAKIASTWGPREESAPASQPR